MKKILIAAAAVLIGAQAFGAADLSFVKDIQPYSVRMILSEMSRNAATLGGDDCGVEAELRAFADAGYRYLIGYPADYGRDWLSQHGTLGTAPLGLAGNVQLWSDIEQGLYQYKGACDGAYAVALLETIDRMPANHYRRPQLISQLSALLTAARDAADGTTGMWDTTATGTTATGTTADGATELDATNSALIVYAALKAANRRYFSTDWKDWAEDIYKKFIDTFVTENSDGTITITSCHPIVLCPLGHDHSGQSVDAENGGWAVAAFIRASMEYEAAENITYVYDGKYVAAGKPATEKVSQDLAFSGAEGGGKYAKGGRGGTVYKVTTLEDTGQPGSLRYAVEAEGPRIVEFSVSGDIHLKSTLTVSNPYVTISGQTAPGAGITVRDFGLHIETNDVIIRYVRFRMGASAGGGGSAVHCVRSDNVIIDHCSLSWGVNADLTLYATSNATVSWCIISEALNSQGGECGYGAVFGGRNVSLHHNLFLSNGLGSPRLDHPVLYSGDDFLYRRGTVECINNVMFNWGDKALWGGEEGWFNVISNWFMPGPGTKAIDGRYIDLSTSAETSMIQGQFFLYGNMLDVGAVYEDGNYLGQKADWKKLSLYDELYRRLSVSAPFRSPNPTTVTDPEKLFKAIIKDAGASKSRDSVDKRLIKELQKGGKPTYSGSVTGIPGLIDSESDVLGQ
ncbi:MAG: glycoside hydrolase family 88 protein [Bacteroidales bacterium]|nr:glycoside hydrolase family 88 protein [Bacteroidales bacterium]